MFQQFELLKNLDSSQINDILETNELYKNISNDDIDQLPKINFNNFVNICHFVDYYILSSPDEFLNNIRYEIYEKNNDIINQINQLSINMQNKIYDNDCLHNMQCTNIKYILYNEECPSNIRHISCYEYFKKKDPIIYYDIDFAARDGHLEIIKYLFNKGQKCTNKAIELASTKGHLDIVEYLFKKKQQYGSKSAIDMAIDLASGNGHFEIVKYLFEIQKQSCSSNAIDWASRIGRLDIVKYLFEVQNSHYTVNSITYASENGHFEVVKYLFSIMSPLIETNQAINGASKNGHFKVVKYLFEKVNHNGTSDSIDYACSNGHLDIVKYLFEKHVIPTIDAIIMASLNNHLDVVKYLVEVVKINDLKNAIINARHKGHDDIVEYLLKARKSRGKSKIFLWNK